MSESPATPTPYEVLGVSPTASQDELRRAYRRMLRESHPDTGGDADRFRAVQSAWRRVGDPADRAAYDRGASSGDLDDTDRTARPASSGKAGGKGAPSSAGPRRSGSPMARTYGHPGGQARDRFLALLHEWVGRGVAIDDPYDPALVRSAPPEIRRLLAKAVAEETTVQQLVTLGIGFTIFNGVEGWDSRYRIDHVVLGPAGLFAVHSADWGAPVRLSKSEIVGDGLGRDETPVKDLVRNARKVAKNLGVRFTGYLVVVPDTDVEDPVNTISRGRAAGASLVSRSILPGVLRGTVGVAAGHDAVAMADVFEVRTRLQEGLELR